MKFKFGLIGLPNVGKSTLFNALTKTSTKVANFPFCTIESNVGTVPILDHRLYKLVEIVNTKRMIPATIEFMDNAGLVKGASKGEGLGNYFLINIRKAEAIGHVVRCFERNDITHVTGKVNPTEDISIINNEQILSDLDICERAVDRLFRKAKIGDKSSKLELAVLEKCLFQLENAGALRSIDLCKEERKLILHLNFLTLKPTMYIANMGNFSIKSNFYLDQVLNIADKEGSIVIPLYTSTRKNSVELEEKENYELMQSSIIFDEYGLNSIIKAGLKLLNLHTYFTVGLKEIRAWTVPVGTTAIQAAKKIHTDLKKGFIRAQIISYEDFILYKGERGAKEAGKMRIEGKDYIVKDGDIINFLFRT